MTEGALEKKKQNTFSNIVFDYLNTSICHLTTAMSFGARRCSDIEQRSLFLMTTWCLDEPICCSVCFVFWDPASHLLGRHCEWKVQKHFVVAQTLWISQAVKVKVPNPLICLLLWWNLGKMGETPWSQTSWLTGESQRRSRGLFGATGTCPTRWQKFYGDHFLKIATTVGD